MSAKRAEKTEVTNSQLDMMRHTVGLDRGKKPYRNHYSSADGCTGIDELLELVDMGLMTKRRNRLDEMGESYIFNLTDSGCRMLGLSGLDAIE